MKISREVFIEIPNKKHAKQMTESVSTNNMRSIIEGHVKMPEMNDQGMITIKSTEPQGSFTAHSRYVETNSSGKNHSYKYELNLPYKIENLVGDGELVISVEANGNWSFLTKSTKTGRELHKERRKKGRNC